MPNIAVINPSEADGLARTILDGMLVLEKQKEIEFKISANFEYILPLSDHVLDEPEFIDFAQKADLVFFMTSKKDLNTKLVKKIGQWNRTLFFDGYETGKNRRYDFKVQRDILRLKYREAGAIDNKMLKKCALYFRREKPYIKGIRPMPFGIETDYLKYYKAHKQKDIDFFCVFGQDEYPLMRRYATEILEKYCHKNKFICQTKKTKTRDEFNESLSRSKVGVSIGGGGYDSMRFWEILGNNCILLTETIDIYNPDSNRFNYKRIWQFNNLYDFKHQLEKLGKFLKSSYRQEDLNGEYQRIVTEHSSVARVREVISIAKENSIIS